MFETMGSYGDWDDYVPAVPAPEEDIESALAADAVDDGVDDGLDPMLAVVAAEALVELEESLDSVRLDGLDADGTLAEAAASVAAERRVLVRQLRLVVHWADLHAVVRRPWLTGPGRERLVQPGGDGTPEVAEFAAAELAAVLGLSVGAGSALLGDALDLRHRFPLLWASVQAGMVPVWVARKTVEQARGLSKTDAATVDVRIVGIVGTVTRGRLSRIVTAAMVAADPARALSDAAEAAAEAGVRVDPEVRYGFQTMMVRATAGDIVAMSQACDLVARALRILGDTRDLEPRRASAVGILANPRTAQHLLEHAEQVRQTRCEAATARRAGNLDLADQIETTLPDHLRPAAAADGSVVADRWEEPGDSDGPDRADATGDQDQSVGLDSPAAGSNGAAGTDPSVEPRRAPTRCDRRPLTFGTAVVYYHLTRDTLDQILAAEPYAGAGVIRMEGIGPVLADQVKQWVGHANVIVKPVIDLAGIQPVDHYETPPPMSEAIGLINGTDSWPHSNATSRRQDNDHTDPYLPTDRGGPPGQTDPLKMAKMSRHTHRVKTFAGWTVHQVRPGARLIRSPHRHYFLVDQHGTTPLGRLC